MTKALTARQKEALSIIDESLSEKGAAPTLTEMMHLMDISTKKGVAFHLDALEKKGFISRSGEARGISLSSGSEGEFISVPLLGYANAGEPLVDAKEEYLGELTVEEKLLRKKRKIFGIELRGDSMNMKHLNGVPMSNGNYVIVAKEAEVNNGDVVLAMVNDGATVKTLKKQKDMYVLYPESSNSIHKPIYLERDDDSILGKVITVLYNPEREGDL